MAKKHVSKSQIISDEFDLVSEPKSRVSVAESAQSKGNESKGDQSKINKNKQNSSSSSCACARKPEILLNEDLGNSENHGLAEATTTTANSETFDTPSLEDYHTEVLQDDQWKLSIFRISGRDQKVLDNIPAILPYFDDHLVSLGQESSVRNVHEYKNHFVNWWRRMNFMTEEEINRKLSQKRSPKYTGRMQTFEDQERLEARMLQRFLARQKGEGR